MEQVSGESADKAAKAEKTDKDKDRKRTIDTALEALMLLVLPLNQGHVQRRADSRTESGRVRHAVDGKEVERVYTPVVRHNAGER